MYEAVEAVAGVRQRLPPEVSRTVPVGSGHFLRQHGVGYMGTHHLRGFASREHHRQTTGLAGGEHESVLEREIVFISTR